MSASQDAAQALGEMGRAFYAAINACTNPDQLVGLNTKLWAEAQPRVTKTVSQLFGMKEAAAETASCDR